ncbi:hypothetical protein [Cohnella sp. JJ-181]|uniref:hypothetical protein n=1 Tax=Cohnella rhizoplanae TaxID=2974897 RepID=UPI0022FFB471|nr:hypothetical protein [Cohnella sp. JJ-181]CAI6086710.1 hypothetical protein COHCIP112018_05139 [Cohnella sp. JJ-181]
MLKWLMRLSPWYRDKQSELKRASLKTKSAIIQYRTASRELQEEIRSNNFAKYLIYEKGD